MKLNTDQRNLIRTGAFWVMYEAFNAGFLIVFALALGASNTVVGILGAIPSIAMILMEIPGAKLVEYFRRKALFLACTGLSRLSWLLILVIPYLFKDYALFCVGAFFFLTRAFEYLADPAWSSWAADLVPDRMRGAFWGRRNMIVSMASAAASLIAGAYLDLFPKESYLGFATLFGAGILLGLYSNTIMAKIKEPEYRDHDHHRLREFFHVDGQFRTYCWIMMLYYFAVNIASPFFTVYMLQNLGLSYTYFVVAGAIATVSRILAHPHFGYVSDKFGDKPVAIICMAGTALVPLAFIFVTPATLWLIVPAQILSGIVWAGMDLTSWNLLLDLTSRDKRALQVAEYNLLTSIPIAIAPVVGGILADNVTIVLTGIPLLFAIAFVLRAVPAFFLTRVHETRAGKERTLSEVFPHVITVHPFHGMERAIKTVVKRVHDEFSHVRGEYPVNHRLPRFQPPR